MKYLLSTVVLISIISSCEHSGDTNSKERIGHVMFEGQEEIDDGRSGPATKFPVIGFKKVHEDTIPYPVEKVFPMFEPQGRHLLYENWEPTVLKEGQEGSLIGQIEFSKYDKLDVLLKVTKHNPEKGHIQYLAVWDDFEIQRIDIFCRPGIVENTTELKWIEHNVGLYKKGVSLVSKFVEEGYLVEAIERYTSNIEKYLTNE